MPPDVEFPTEPPGPEDPPPSDTIGKIGKSGKPIVDPEHYPEGGNGGIETTTTITETETVVSTESGVGTQVELEILEILDGE